MDPNVRAWMEMAFRWVHVIAGVAWVGHAYFSAFVGGQVSATLDAESKRKVVPELVPRVLYWLRWGAAYTWITGFMLAGLVYYMQRAQLLPLGSSLGTGAATGIGVGVWVVGFVVYDQLWKALEKNEAVGAALSLALVAAVAYGLSQVYSGRAVYIHVGGLFGTLMAANAWMRIWPAQRKMLAALKANTAPDAARAERAALRLKHNTYMSVPVIFTMVSNHYPEIYAARSGDVDLGWVYLTALVGLGFLVTKALYAKAASPAPGRF